MILNLPCVSEHDVPSHFFAVNCDVVRCTDHDMVSFVVVLTHDLLTALVLHHRHRGRRFSRLLHILLHVFRN